MKIYRNGDVVGTKRLLIYHSSDAKEDGRWSMNEYLLTNNSQIGQYALCSIQRKLKTDTERKTSGSSKRTTSGTVANKEPGKPKKRKTASSAQQQDYASMTTSVPSSVPLQLGLRGDDEQGRYPSDAGDQQFGASASTSAPAPGCRGDMDMAAQFHTRLTFCEHQPSLGWSSRHPLPSSAVDVGGAHLNQPEDYGSFFRVPNDDTEHYFRRQLVGAILSGKHNSNWDAAYSQHFLQSCIELQQWYGSAAFGQAMDDRFSASFEGGSVASESDDSSESSSC